MLIHTSANIGYIFRVVISRVLLLHRLTSLGRFALFKIKTKKRKKVLQKFDLNFMHGVCTQNPFLFAECFKHKILTVISWLKETKQKTKTKPKKWLGMITKVVLPTLRTNPTLRVSVLKARVESIRAFFKQHRNKADARHPISKTPTKGRTDELFMPRVLDRGYQFCLKQIQTICTKKFSTLHFSFWSLWLRRP